MNIYTTKEDFFKNIKCISPSKIMMMKDSREEKDGLGDIILSDKKIYDQ